MSDPIEDFQQQQAQEAINREAFKQDLIEWEYTVMSHMEDLSVWLFHLHQNLMDKGLPFGFSLQMCTSLMAQYIVYKGNGDFFRSMPDITQLLVETRIPTVDSLSKQPEVDGEES